ncbi:MAG: hypothetical protein KDK99_09385 [Verrucomicrobiales bacterium]|nr:hypothetical protein [Verrucomicrobiales bacterium]
MAKFFRFSTLALLAALSLGFTACETQSTTAQVHKKRKPVPPGSDSNLSSLPWNRPPSWEGSARYGSMMPQSR